MATMQDLQKYLDNASVSAEIFTLRPDYRALLMIVDGLTPGVSDDASEALLQNAEASARAELARYAITEIPHVMAWREAYKGFGAKPQRTRNSLEALTRRAGAEPGLPRVNRLTDIYNAISVKNQIPLGGEDLDKYVGAPRLVRATGKEEFETMVNGEVVVEHPDVGEVVWCDDAGVTCRRWNWRQGPRTALSDQTTRALFILDVLDPITDEFLAQTADELTAELKRLGPEVCVASRVIRAPGNM